MSLYYYDQYFNKSDMISSYKFYISSLIIEKFHPTYINISSIRKLQINCLLIYLFMCIIDKIINLPEYTLQFQQQYAIQMGGCTQSKSKPQQQQQDPLPLLNLLIVGLAGSGKSTILSQLKGQPQSTCNQQLGIDSFVINKRVKIIAFQVAGRGSRSWCHYYQIAHIILFVIDCMESESYCKIQQMIKQMDQQLRTNAKIIVVFNKVDLLLTGNMTMPVNQETSHVTEYLDKNSNKVKDIDKLDFRNLKHQVFTCKVSGKDKIGVNNLLRKVYCLAQQEFYGTNQNENQQVEGNNSKNT